MMPCKIEKNIGNHYKQACNFFIIQSNKKVLILNHFMLYILMSIFILLYRCCRKLSVSRRESFF